MRSLVRIQVGPPVRSAKNPVTTDFFVCLLHLTTSLIRSPKVVRSRLGTASMVSLVKYDCDAGDRNRCDPDEFRQSAAAYRLPLLGARGSAWCPTSHPKPVGLRSLHGARCAASS